MNEQMGGLVALICGFLSGAFRFLMDSDSIFVFLHVLCICCLPDTVDNLCFWDFFRQDRGYVQSFICCFLCYILSLGCECYILCVMATE